ncbi:uncharacterized protein LOC128789948 isoform X1 [Vidua chalybeata]|uniref:uncharacterized protein LOC128789948 isoform X1 n=2 Tax=Vidua chalybeata TaxID=81927 RepID=UPI0023A7BB1E|nr:uncharacterized protein LOC128789948 isoform X1 [Vidua chalybeata]
MVFLDSYRMLGPVKLSYSCLTFLLTFFQMQTFKICGRAPLPGQGVFPEKEVQADSCSQGQVCKVSLLPSACEGTESSGYPPGSLLSRIKISGPRVSTSYPGIYRRTSKSRGQKTRRSVNVFQLIFKFRIKNPQPGVFFFSPRLGFFFLGPGRSARRRSSPKFRGGPSRDRGFRQAGEFFRTLPGTTFPRSVVHACRWPGVRGAVETRARVGLCVS